MSVCERLSEREKKKENTREEAEKSPTMLLLSPPEHVTLFSLESLQNSFQSWASDPGIGDSKAVFAKNWSSLKEEQVIFNIKISYSHEDPWQVRKRCLSPEGSLADKDQNLGKSLASQWHTTAKKSCEAMEAVSCWAGGQADSEMAFQVLYETTHHYSCSLAQTLPLEGTFKKNQESLKQLTQATPSDSHHGHWVRGR